MQFTMMRNTAGGVELEEVEKLEIPFLDTIFDMPVRHLIIH